MNMKKEHFNNIRLGIFVILGGLILIFGLYTIGKNKNLFGETFTLYAYFYDVNGLTAGSNVRYSGIDVGTVKKLVFENDSTIKIVMQLENDVRKFIRKNSIAAVGTDGLMGNKLVNISPGTANAPVITDEDVIPSLRTVNTDAMLRTLDQTNSNIASISRNLKVLTDNFEKSRGTLYRVLMDTALAINLESTLQNFNLISRNLIEASYQISEVTGSLNDTSGVLGLLTNDTSVTHDLKFALKEIRRGSEKFTEATMAISELMQDANAGKGILPSLLKDSTIKEDFVTTLENLQSASIKLNEDLEGLKHSFLLRGYFRRLEKQKKKEAEKTWDRLEKK